MFIEELFKGKSPEGLHNEFLKFGRGEYKNKYLLLGKKQKDRWIIKTGPEFANYLVKRCLNEMPEKVNIQGIVVSTFDIRNDANFPILGVKQFMGVKQFSVSGEINKGSLMQFILKYPRVFYALSFSSPDIELKIKAKAPKSPKPSSNGEKEQKVDFCILKTSNKAIIRELFFDLEDFDEVKIAHTLKINEIVYPKNEKDPTKVRENSIRKGQIIRIVETQGNKTEKFANFEG